MRRRHPRVPRIPANERERTEMRMTRFLNGAGLAVGGLMMAASGGLAAEGDTNTTAPLATPPPAESPMAPADKIEPRMPSPNGPRQDGRVETPPDRQPGTPLPAEEAETPRQPAPRSLLPPKR